MLKDQVKSAVRALDVLEVLATSEEGLSLGEVTRLIEAPKSSTLMLLRTLVDRSYVERDHSDRYRISSVLGGHELGWIGGQKALLVRKAMPVMRQLTERVRETSLLATLTPDKQVRLLTKVVSPREIRYDAILTKLNPAHQIASGRVQLAYLPAREIRAYIAKWAKAKVSPTLRVDPQALRRDLAEVRSAGFALAIDQWEAGATGVSAPIFDAGGGVCAAITIGAVTARFLADREEIVAAVRAAATEITGLNGGTSRREDPPET